MFKAVYFFVIFFPFWKIDLFWVSKKITGTPGFGYKVYGSYSRNDHTTEPKVNFDHISEISSSAMCKWLVYRKLKELWVRSQPNVEGFCSNLGHLKALIAVNPAPSLQGHLQPRNWPPQPRKLTIYPKWRPYIRKILLYEIPFHSGPAKDWPNSRKDHISEDLITETRCNSVHCNSLQQCSIPPMEPIPALEPISVIPMKMSLSQNHHNRRSKIWLWSRFQARSGIITSLLLKTNNNCEVRRRKI